MDKANVGECFHCLDGIVPSAQNHTLANLKKEFTAGGTGVDFPDRLRTFIRSMNGDLAGGTTAEVSFRPHLLTAPEINKADYGHCLRPAFTQTVLHHTYVRPKSLNLIGPTGAGKLRQLEDVLRIARAHQLRSSLADIKGFRGNYEGFLQKMANDLHLTQTRYTRFEDIVDAIHQQTYGQPCLLLVANLDTLNDYSHNDPRYNALFVSSLNNFKNNAQVQLICTSREPLNKVVFEHETSMLELHPLEMPEYLDDRDLDAEIRRCTCPLEDTHRDALRKTVRDRPDAYALLTHLLSKAESHYRPDCFETALPKWLQDYGK